MIGIRRVRISLDSQWGVVFTFPDGSVSARHQLRREKVPNAAPRDTPNALPWPNDGGPPSPVEVQSMADRCRRVAQRAPASQAANNDYDVVVLGRHFFTTLLAPEWPNVLTATSDAPLVELALEWSKDERDLHRLNWELLHGPDGFLAAGFTDSQGRLRRFTVSRVVTEASLPPRPLSPQPRILFVVGCSLNDPRIRAGAEFFGLLRQIRAKERGGTIVTQRYLPIRLLQEASPARLRREIGEFQPEIVHLISHGRAEPNTPPSLLLQPDPGQSGEQWKEAEALLDLLTIDAPNTPQHGQRPSIVILSACFSGTAAAGNNQALGGPGQGPLAAQLVAGGIPVVIGMAGQIADQACRLFTRTFGEALVYGKALNEAMEAGRRAAFTLGDWPLRSVDWALPTLYRAIEIKPDFALTAPDRSAEERWLQNALAGLGIQREREPVFATRFEFLDGHYDKLRSGKPGTLLVLGPAASGKSRLLRELAAQAISQGHVPLLISADNPVDLTKFAHPEAIRTTWLGALVRLCKALRISVPVSTFQLQRLQPALAGGARTDLHPDLQTALDLSPDSLQPLFAALQLDLQSCVQLARAQAPARHGPATRAWLLLDHVHLYDQERIRDFFDPDLTGITSFGLSQECEAPVPVVFAFDPEADRATGLKDVAEGKCRTWLPDLTLERFARDGSDVLTYGRVLLSPHDPDLYASAKGVRVSALSWVIDPEAPDATREEWLAELRHKLKGQPGDFIRPDLYEWVHYAQRDKFLRLADDEDKLRQLRP